MENVDFEIDKQSVFDETNITKNNLANLILNLNQDYVDKKFPLTQDDFSEFVCKIFSIINAELDRLSNELFKNIKFVKKNQINLGEEYKIDSKGEIKNFTSREIQEENKKITRNFQNESYKNINGKGKIKNENVAHFFKTVAIISRTSFKVSLNILESMKKNFNKIKGNSFSIKDENYKKEFSAWVKQLEIENQLKEKSKIKLYENFLNKENIFKTKENIKNKEYLINLYHDLTLLYFHCHIAFPFVEIDFTKKENFDSETMIDFINLGQLYKKVNFVILPSLISNGCFLENGKSFVFTYFDDTFKFEDDIIDKLKIEEMKIEYIKSVIEVNINYEEEDNTKYVYINTNIDNLEDLKYKFVFQFSNFGDKYETKSKKFEIAKIWEITKFEFELEGKTIISKSYLDNKN